MKCATISENSRRWIVDRATAKSAVVAAGIKASPLYISPRYAWDDLLRRVEGWPVEIIDNIDIHEPLQRAEDLADLLGVTSQTVRNYGRSGKLTEIRISARAIRYCAQFSSESTSEEKSGEAHKR